MCLFRYSDKCKLYYCKIFKQGTLNTLFFLILILNNAFTYVNMAKMIFVIEEIAKLQAF